MTTPTTKLANGVSFADWLGSELARQGLSQRALSLRAGVDHTSISRILAGTREPAFDTARRLAGALGYRISLERPA